MHGKYLYYAVAALLGVLCSISMTFPWIFLSLFYFWSILFFKKLSKNQTILLILVFLFFMVSSEVYELKHQTKFPPSTTVFYLQFSSLPVLDGSQFKAYAEETRLKEKLHIFYQMKSENEKEELKKQNVFHVVCRVTGKLEKPPPAKNVNGFDYRQYLNRKEIYWELKVNQFPLAACTEANPNLLVMLKSLRFYGIQYLDDNFPAKIAAMASALIYGDRSGMEPELLEDYQKSGIIHLLSISGLHVSLFIAAFYYLGLRAGVPREWMTRIVYILLPVYAILTGGSPSVVRSVLMIFLVLLTEKGGNTVKLFPVDAICLAFIFYLFADPMILYDVGFQLSFSVSAAIILSSPVIFKRYHTGTFRMIVTSITAQVSAFPILLFHFYGLSFISIAANLVFIPLYSFVLLPGVYLLVGIHLLVGSVPDPILNFFIFLLDGSSWLAKITANLSFFQLSPGRPHWSALVLYIIDVIAIFVFWEKKHTKSNRWILFGLTVFLLSFQVVVNKINPVGEVTLIDVGQGESIFIHLPFNKGNYLIDTGGTISFNKQGWEKRKNDFEVGKNIVVPYLKGKGITTIDKLILTHADTDHIGGALAVIKTLTVKEIIIPAVKEITDNEAGILQEAARKKVTIIQAAEGDYWKSGDSEFRVLSPPNDFAGERNRGSLTILAGVGGLSWFFGGDLDRIGEEGIVRRYPNLKIDILKVGHHGSNTSSSPIFLQHYRPKISLISVGEKNRFGHPNNQVIERLGDINSGIYRTDKQGAITYRFFGREGTFSTFLP